MICRAALVVLITFAAACGHAPQERAFGNSIGYATISAQGVITLYLVGSTDDGSILHAVAQYAPSDPEYGKIAEHVGPIRVGEEKNVTPFPTRAPERVASSPRVH